MDIERRALYTALRLNWLQDPTLKVEDWQVEDYREIPYSLLFSRLRDLGLPLDRVAFLALAEECESPEELADKFSNSVDDAVQLDRIYLLLFELWRRLMTDSPSLSIFCEELDYQVGLYDLDTVDNSEALTDVVMQLQVILEENSDYGVDPQEAFLHVSRGCAHHLEEFLIDYISEQFDEHQDGYAAELFDGFQPYLPHSFWFDFLKARVVFATDRKGALQILKTLLNRSTADFGLDLELFSLLSLEGERYLAIQAFSRCIKYVGDEEDLRELLVACLEDQENMGQQNHVDMLHKLLQQRSQRRPDEKVASQDPIFDALKKIIS